MENYKSFMDKQHPSEALLKDTIRRAEELSETPGKKHLHGWRSAVAAAAVFCLLAGGIWKWNSKITYTDLNQTAVNAESDLDEKNVSEIKKSYLGDMVSDSYIFDSTAEISEIKTGNGTIRIQVGTVLNTGLQALYQTTPEQIKGYAVHFGKYRTENKNILLAAFVKEDMQYYLEGKDVTEKEMTAAVRDLLN